MKHSDVHRSEIPGCEASKGVEVGLHLFTFGCFCTMCSLCQSHGHTVLLEICLFKTNLP